MRKQDDGQILMQVTVGQGLAYSKVFTPEGDNVVPDDAVNALRSLVDAGDGKGMLFSASVCSTLQKENYMKLMTNVFGIYEDQVWKYTTARYVTSWGLNPMGIDNTIPHEKIGKITMGRI